MRFPPSRHVPLVVAGLLESRKGHGGGFRMLHAPGEVSYAEILRATDIDVDEDACAFGWGDCDPKNPCPLHPSWARLKDSMAEWAESHTLADVRWTASQAKRRRRGR